MPHNTRQGSPRNLLPEISTLRQCWRCRQWWRPSAGYRGLHTSQWTPGSDWWTPRGLAHLLAFLWFQTSLKLWKTSWKSSQYEFDLRWSISTSWSPRNSSTTQPKTPFGCEVSCLQHDLCIIGQLFRTSYWRRRLALVGILGGKVRRSLLVQWGYGPHLRRFAVCTFWLIRFGLGKWSESLALAVLLTSSLKLRIKRLSGSLWLGRRHL